jgi:putative transposase
LRRLLARGIFVPYETVRRWALEFGPDYARSLKRKTPSRRDAKAAKRLLKRVLRKQGRIPRRMTTDKLGSYAAARRQIMPAVEHRSHRGLNNRAENSHLSLRKRERAMEGFRSPET